jgi:hypothetical protein
MQPTATKATEAKKNGPANAPAPGKPAPAAAKTAPFDGEGADTTDSGKDEKRPELPREEKRKLFDAVFATEKEVKAAEDAVAVAVDKRSVAVRKLIEMCGNGPWRVNGQVLRASSRGDTAFLKRPGDENIEEV